MQRNYGWFPLFSTNFISVLNDNFMKWLIIFIFIMTMPKDNQGLFISLANGLFVIPYILFSSYAGNLAKKYQKVAIVRISKLMEIPIMLLTAIGFFYHSLPVVLIALFFMGIQSSMFSPAKYGLIRDVGGKKRVSFGTGAMEMLTFLGVLIGTYLGGEFSDSNKFEILREYQDYFVTGSLILFAVIGWLLSLGIKANEPAVEESEGTIIFTRFISNSVKWSKHNLPKLNYVVFGLSFFWLIASLIQMNLILYCERIFSMTSSEIGFSQAIIAMAIACGSIFVGIISRNGVRLKLVSIGTIMMFLSLSLLYLLPPSKLTFYVLMTSTAFFAGVYKIPLNAWMQAHVAGRKLGEMIAFNNLMVFIFILLSAGLFAIFTALLSTETIFLAIAILTLIICIVLMKKLPESRLFYSKMNQTIK